MKQIREVTENTRMGVKTFTKLTNFKDESRIELYRGE